MSIDSFLSKLLKEQQQQQQTIQPLTPQEEDGEANNPNDFFPDGKQQEQQEQQEHKQRHEPLKIVLIQDNAKLDGERNIMYSLPFRSRGQQQEDEDAKRREGRWCFDFSPSSSPSGIMMESPFQRGRRRGTNSHHAFQRDGFSSTLTPHSPPSSLTEPLARPQRRESMGTQHSDSSSMPSQLPDVPSLNQGSSSSLLSRGEDPPKHPNRRISFGNDENSVEGDANEEEGDDDDDDERDIISQLLNQDVATPIQTPTTSNTAIALSSSLSSSLSSLRPNPNELFALRQPQRKSSLVNVRNDIIGTRSSSEDQKLVIPKRQPSKSPDLKAHQRVPLRTCQLKPQAAAKTATTAATATTTTVHQSINQ